MDPPIRIKLAGKAYALEMYLSDNFESKFRKLTEIHFEILKNHSIEFNWPDLEAQFFESVNFLKQFNLIDSEYFINDELNKNSSVLAEGAQGSFLILTLAAILL